MNAAQLTLSVGLLAPQNNKIEDVAALPLSVERLRRHESESSRRNWSYWARRSNNSFFCMEAVSRHRPINSRAVSLPANQKLRRNTLGRHSWLLLSSPSKKLLGGRLLLEICWGGIYRGRFLRWHILYRHDGRRPISIITPRKFLPTQSLLRTVTIPSTVNLPCTKYISCRTAIRGVGDQGAGIV